MTELGPDEITASEAARIMGVSRQYINRAAHDGKLPGRQVLGRYWVFKRMDVIRFAAREKSKGGRPKSDVPELVAA